jgi:hypothetical protein
MVNRNFAYALLAGTALIAGCGRSSDADYRRRVTAVDAPAASATAAEAAPQNKFGFMEAPMAPSIVAPLAANANREPQAPALGISPAAAPGVAFNYRYAFVLPDNAIAAVQEQHATACEKLGPTQCRIIGMRYRLVDKDQVEAYLQFKLSPALARNFGKDGIAAVQKAEGKLVDASIEGNDVGSQITASEKRSSEIAADLHRIEGRIASVGKDSYQRESLNRMAESLRAQILSEKHGQADNIEQLANTPMTFTYGGEGSFTLGRHPFRDAGLASWSGFVTMASAVLLGLGYSLPWLLLLAALLWLWRSRLGRSLRGFLPNRTTRAADFEAPEITPDS